MQDTRSHIIYTVHIARGNPCVIRVPNLTPPLELKLLPRHPPTPYIKWQTSLLRRSVSG